MAARAADAGGASAAPTAKSKQVTFEVLGNGTKRITLSAKAAERLGIATDKVSEQTVTRRQMMGGLVIPPMDLQATPAGTANNAQHAAAAPKPPRRTAPARRFRASASAGSAFRPPGPPPRR
jgi:hypothetical protein